MTTITPEIFLTPHAAERFRERARPALDPEHAGAELGRVAPVGVVSAVAPEWHARGTADVAPLYLLIGDDVVLPLRESRRAPGTYAATTCFSRGSLSEATRERRSARRRRFRRDDAPAGRPREAYRRPAPGAGAWERP